MTRSLPLFFASLLLAACGGSTFETGSSSPNNDAGTDGAAGASGGGGAAGTGGADGGDGSAGTGGADGGDGSAGAGGSDGGTAHRECTHDGDCTLLNDCCTCAGIPNNMVPPSCAMTCAIASCSAAGIQSAKCVAGRCVAGFSCDAKQVTCDMAPPSCPVGQTPEVSNACYTGRCVPAEQCASVTECGECTGGLACVGFPSMMGTTRHCVTVPGECNDDTSCGCLGPTVCDATFNACSDVPNGVTCSCPTC